jgi:hypothetical protein
VPTVFLDDLTEIRFTVLHEEVICLIVLDGVQQLNYVRTARELHVELIIKETTSLSVLKRRSSYSA